MNRKVWIIWLGCVVMVFFAKAQITPVVTSDKEKILIGESVKLTLELRAIDRNATVKWLLPDSIPHFEYISYDTTDLLKREITISSFDSGVWKIDNIAVIVPSNVNNKPLRLKFPPQEISVEYDTTGSRIMNDIKPIIEVDSMQKWIGYLVAAAAVLSLFVLIFLFKKWRKKKIVAVEKENALSALEDFQQTIHQLKQQSWNAQTDQKQQFSTFTAAIKKYFERKLHLPFSKLTTGELLLELQLYMSNDELIQLTQGLRLSDAVKFAKFAAPKQDCINILNCTEQLILKTDKQLSADA